MERIQLIAIAGSVFFMSIVIRFIIKGRLREEYAIVWILSTTILLIFSFWRNGLEKLSQLLGIFEAPNMVFTGAIFAVLVYLLHLSVVASKLHDNNKTLAQELAFLREKISKLTDEKNTQPE
jgi:hypothetical protein